jgi:hypothetical protein
LVVMTTRTTTTAVQLSGPAGLQMLARRFITWRATRPRGQRIPTELWQAATAMARVYGINPTVAALKINYYDLQRRLHHGEGGGRGSQPAPVFVEVPPVALPPGGGERGLVELVHAGGARLILHRGVAGVDELLPLVELFLRHGR